MCRRGASRSRLAPLDLPSSVGFADIFSRKREKGARQAAVSFSARVTADGLDALGRADEAAAVRARYGPGGGA